MMYRNVKFAEEHQINKKLKSFLNFFYFWGNSPILIFSDPQKKPPQFVKQVPAIFFILFTGYLLILGIKLHYEAYINKQIPNLLVSIIYILLESTVGITIYLQCLFHKNALNSALEHVQFLVDFFRNKFQFEIPLEKGLREIHRDLWKISSIFIIGILANGLVKVTVSTRKDGGLSFFIDALQIPMIIVTMHFILYVNLMKFMMSQLNKLIIQHHTYRGVEPLNFNHNHSIQCRRHFCNKICLSSIKRMKLIYYRLWRITQLINEFFGWSIAAAIIQNVVYISSIIFWGYILLMNGNITFSIVGPIVGILTAGSATVMTINAAQKLYHQVNFFI